MLIWYITIPNALFGIACYIFAHTVRFSEAGKDCASFQPGRGRFLFGDVIVFWVSFALQ